MTVALGVVSASMAELKRLTSWREASAQDAELEKPTNIPSTGRASTSLRCPVPVRGSEVQPSQGEGPRREGRYPRRRGVGCSRTTFSRLGAHLGRSPTRVWRVQIGGRQSGEGARSARASSPPGRDLSTPELCIPCPQAMGRCRPSSALVT